MKQEIKIKALLLLSKKAYFSYELSKKLQAKGFTIEDIEPVLSELKKAQLLNDEELASRVCELYAKRGYGPKVISQKLFEKMGKRIPLSFSESSEPLSLLIERRYKKLLPHKRQNVIAALYRRGFSLTAIAQALSTFSNPSD